MREARSTLILLWMVFTIASDCGCNQHPSQSSSSSEAVEGAPSEKTKPLSLEWRSFEESKKRFRILMPGPPTPRNDWPPFAHKDIATDLGALKMTFFGRGFIESELYVEVAVGDYPPAATFGQKDYDQPILKEAVHFYLKGIGAEEESTFWTKDIREIKLDGRHNGLECRAHRPQTTHECLIRVYLVGNRRVQLKAVWRNSKANASKEALKFMDSLRVVVP